MKIPDIKLTDEQVEMMKSITQPGLEGALKHCTPGRAEVGVAIPSNALNDTPVYCVSIDLGAKDKAPKIIAITGIVNAGDDIESVANAHIIEQLWNKHVNKH